MMNKKKGEENFQELLPSEKAYTQRTQTDQHNVFNQEKTNDKLI